MKLSQTPSCNFYQKISNHQSEKGFFHCKKKNENIHLHNCGSCPNKDEVLREMARHMANAFAGGIGGKIAEHLKAEEKQDKK